MATSWSEVLDLYGRALLDFDAALGTGDPAHASFEFKLPSDLGPLPPELADVAANVAALSADVERHVREAMDETAHEQAAVTRARSLAARERRQAKFIDVNS
ncbi:MAG: hypothetical protein ACRDV3_11690 [Acidothermaceae bacterium]